MLLADLGAEIIKVERPGTGDDTRSWGPPFWQGTSTYFAAVNRGKKSIAVDLGREEAGPLVTSMVSAADVVIENFRPGVADRLGIGYQRLRDVNPALIYASINGFGSFGPKSGEAGTEVIVEAETGLMAMMGAPGGPPVRFGIAMVDIATGGALVSGILAALLQRERTGIGRRLEFPLYSTAFSVLATVIASGSVDPVSQSRRFGSGHPSVVPYAAFECLDGWAVLGAINSAMWRRLCDALGLDELRADQRTATNESRVEHRDFVDSAIGEAVASRTVAAVISALNAAGVLGAPVKAAVDAIKDPQVSALGLLDIDDGVNFSRTPLAQFNRAPLSRAPQLGQHSRELLAGLVSLEGSEIDELVASGVVQETTSGSEGGTPSDADARRLESQPQLRSLRRLERKP